MTENEDVCDSSANALEEVKMSRNTHEDEETARVEAAYFSRPELGRAGRRW